MRIYTCHACAELGCVCEVTTVADDPEPHRCPYGRVCYWALANREGSQ